MRNPIPSTIAILCLAAGSLFAQGKVSFNLSTLNPVPLVTNILTGQGVGSDFRAQLFYGNSGDSSTFAPVWSTLSGTLSTPFTFGAIPGLINDNTAKYTDPTKVEGGTTGYFQIRVWSAALGADWGTAFQNWASQPANPNLSLSSSMVVKVNNIASATAVPPSTPSQLVGMQSFGILPEPSTFALGALGLAVILWRRRR